MAISAAARQMVRVRALDQCEYCGLPQAGFPFAAFHVEHIIPRQHGGSDDELNLCLACHWCNFHKGPNLASHEQGQLVPLFNPRTESWDDHFVRRNDVIEGRTLTGRVTVRIMSMNDPDRIELRRSTKP